MNKDILLTSAAIYVPQALFFSILPESLAVSNILASMVFALFVLSSLAAMIYLIWIFIRAFLYLVGVIFANITRVEHTSLRLRFK
jgi:hypothetical protein